MIVLIIIVAYLIIGAITLSLCIRMRPYWFYTYFLDSTKHEYCNHWNQCTQTHHGCKTCEKIISGLTGEEGSRAYYINNHRSGEGVTFCVMFWWAWAMSLFFNMISNATKRGVNNGLSTRAELNKELTELKKEIDALRNDKE
jgi:hypothetical protein